MKPLHLLLALLIFSTSIYSCKKKKSGICYCHYFSGDKKEFDLTHLSRSQQIDTCYLYDKNAEAFAGDCDLK